MVNRYKNERKKASQLQKQGKHQQQAAVTHENINYGQFAIQPHGQQGYQKHAANQQEIFNHPQVAAQLYSRKNSRSAYTTLLFTPLMKNG